MKKPLSLVGVILILVLAFSGFAITAQAKIFSECHTCGGKGKYVCDNPDCGGKGTYPCSSRPDPNAKKCKNGYVTENCPQCHGSGDGGQCGNCHGTKKCVVCEGDGKQGDLNDRICNQCGGTGKCVTCGGNGRLTCSYCKGKKTITNKCPDCNGTGILKCTNQLCVWGRANGGKCKTCKGTGFEGDGVEGTPNDGVSNVPKKGDGIYRLDGSYYVYGGSNNNNNNNTTQKTNSGTSAAAAKTSSAVNGTTASTELLPGAVSILPNDRISDFDIVANPDGGNQNYFARVEVGKMNEQQRKLYESMPARELGNILGNVSKIVSTAKPGQADENAKSRINEVAKASGLDAPEDANIYPIAFQGHQYIGFPVAVTVSFNKGEVNGAGDTYIYHIKDDGTIEPLGVAEKGTYEDGSVSQLTFYTTGFSSFFTASKELNTDIAPQNDPQDLKTIGADGNGINPVIYYIIAAVTVAAAGLITFIILKNRKKKVE